MIAVAVFSRAPVPGRAKRRLVPALGEAGAAALHRRMVERTVATAVAASVGPVELWCTPSIDHELFAGLAREHGLARLPQAGPDLGARMEHAFRVSLDRHRALILIGTDCPALAPEDLREAARCLATGDDAVIAPAADGGYVLLGLGRSDPMLFEGIPWGEAGVLAATEERLAGLGWRWRALRTLPDVDRPEDLRHLPPDLAVALPVDSGG